MKTRATTLLSLTITVIALIAATSAQGAAKSIDVPVGPQPHTLAHAKPFSKMSLSEIEHFQRHALARYLYVSRYFLHWRETHYVRYLLAADERMSPCSATGVLEPANYCWYAKAARWTQRELSETEKKLALTMLPSHIALWRCIAGYPGARPGGGTGESGGYQGASNGTHFNVLQMTMPWGEGSYYVADPIHATADSVIAAAERGYAANGYSRSWLTGQWGQTVGPCLSFA